MSTPPIFLMEITGDIKIINKAIEKFARIDGKPLYRLVWSDDQYEHRRGVFNDFTESGLFIRSYVGVREARKYTNIFERWVLEMLLPPDYECLFVFEGAIGQFLHPTLKVCEFIIQQNEKFRLARPSPLSRAVELRDEARFKEDEEIQDFVEALDCSPIQSLLHSREALGYKKGSND